MKIFLILFILLFASPVFAEVGDVYYCETTINAEVKKNDVKEYTSQTFKFLRKENLIEFGKGGYFDKESMKVEDPERFIGEFFYGSGSRWERFVYNEGVFVFAFTMNSDKVYVTAIVATCDIF